MNAEECEEREAKKTRKRPPRQKRNPIEAAVRSWYEKHEIHLQNQHNVSDLIAQAPKRWTAYGPLVLLPAGSFTSAAWRDVLDLTANPSVLGSIDDNEKMGEDDKSLRGPALLWKTILDEISASPKAKLTHLAINEGIPLHSKPANKGVEATVGGSENILRSPSGLRMLYGDFGPSRLSTPVSDVRENEAQPGDVAEADFSSTFWVSTKQNGITQTWAPRWTMFSRGNIKEKARLLDFHDAGNSTTHTRDQQDSDLSHRHIPAEQRMGALAVDLYAGIGYFAFCYAALGFRVLCWELNAWSVEGLRRGAGANGWSVRVVRPPSELSNKTEEEEDMLKGVLAGDETIVVFLEDNARAAGRIKRLDELTRERETQQRHDGEGTDRLDIAPLRMSDVVHVNCGLLPTSRGSWTTAWDIASEAQRAWLHVHENVGVSDIEAMKEEIREWFTARTLERSDEVGTETHVCAEHVELVKTFAPDVWHCVFDLYVKRCTSRSRNIT
ncbi:S-adenosyl-L-methionine-dependent methyltransferase [Xylaria sp. FL1777]|nr:S-adenosyl-L-methionine-dependent methyltransferase [Xylaria sp. FL1777]